MKRLFNWYLNSRWAWIVIGLPLAVAATAYANTYFPIPNSSLTDHPNTGFCRVTPFGESSVNRTTVFCRYTVDDLTNDGQGEVSELRIILKPNGKVDCSLSVARVLDLTRGRNQDVIPIQPLCQ